jgi:hypothetical protein
VGTVVGAAVGTTLRYAAIATWPDPVPLLISTLSATAVAFVVFGLVLTDAVPPAWRTVSWGFFGAVASLSVLALAAILASSLLSLAYLLGAPVAGICGLAIGMAAGLMLNRRTHPRVA